MNTTSQAQPITISVLLAFGDASSVKTFSSSLSKIRITEIPCDQIPLLLSSDTPLFDAVFMSVNNHNPLCTQIIPTDQPCSLLDLYHRNFNGLFDTAYVIDTLDDSLSLEDVVILSELIKVALSLTYNRPSTVFSEDVERIFEHMLRTISTIASVIKNPILDTLFFAELNYAHHDDMNNQASLFDDPNMFNADFDDSIVDAKHYPPFETMSNDNLDVLASMTSSAYSKANALNNKTISFKSIIDNAQNAKSLDIDDDCRYTKADDDGDDGILDLDDLDGLDFFEEPKDS